MPAAHAWMPHRDHEAFLVRGRRFLADGAGLDRLVYVSGRSREEMWADVADLPDVDDLLARGELALLPYDAADVVRAEEQVAAFAAATDHALATGLRGLRVLADLTGFAGGPQQQSLLRYEHLAERYMRDHPMSALCGVDVRAVAEPAVAAVESLHPQHDEVPVSGFRLLPDDAGLRLTGVVESWDAEHLAAVLVAVARPPDTVRLRVDEVRHLSARAVTALERHARLLRDGGGRLVVDGAPAVVARACRVLDMDLLLAG